MKKGFFMDVAASQSNAELSSAIPTDALQKAIEINQQQAMKIIENAIEESKQIAAQKTGIGRNLNITG